MSERLRLRREFDRELEAIEAKIIELFAIVAEDLSAVTQALMSGNSDVTGQVAEREQAIIGAAQFSAGRGAAGSAVVVSSSSVVTASAPVCANWPASCRPAASPCPGEPQQVRPGSRWRWDEAKEGGR